MDTTITRNISIENNIISGAESIVTKDYKDGYIHARNLTRKIM